MGRLSDPCDVDARWTYYAWELLGLGLDMPGCVIVHKPYQMGVIIERLAEIYEDNDEVLTQRVIRLTYR